MLHDERKKRIASRREVLGPALLKGPELRTNCIIRDLSARGARLEVPHSIPLPSEFNLLFLKANTSRHVRLRWRRGDLAGVEFTGEDVNAADVETTPDECAKRLNPPAAGNGLD
jgi:hypothetical protein